LSVDAPKLTEGGPGQTSNMTFTVTLAKAVEQDITISYVLADITATGSPAAGAGNDNSHDYDNNGLPGTLVIPKGATSGIITVPVFGDFIVEGNETFGLDLALQPITIGDTDYGATFKAANIATPYIYRAIGTITDDEAIISIEAPKIFKEGSFGQTTNMTFTVKLAKAVPQDVTVDYMLANGTATGASVSVNDGIHDYDNVLANVVTSPVSGVIGTLTIPANSLSGTISVPVFGDSVSEGNETLILTLSSPTGGSFKGGAGSLSTTGTIIDDEVLITVDAPKIVEGGPGSTTLMTFTVKLAARVTGGVTFSYSTADGTAAAFSDYSPINFQSISFTDDGSTTDKEILITVDVIGDARVEGSEYFILNLSNPVGAIFKGGGTILPAKGTITDDEGILTVDAPKIKEGNDPSPPTPINMTFTVTLAAAVLQDVTIDYSTVDITATAGSDYTNSTGQIIISQGTTTGTISVPILGDTGFESDETFGLNLSMQNITPSDPFSGTGAVFKGGKTTYQAIGTIQNDEGILSVDAPKKTEGGVGDTGFMTFTVKLKAALTQPVTVDYTIANGTATGDSASVNDGIHDYDNVLANVVTSPVSGVIGTLTIPANSLSGTISVPVFGDSLVEGNETINLILSNPVGAGFKASAASLQTTGTIIDDEGVLSSANVSVKENIGGAPGVSGMMAFIVKLAKPIGQDVTLHYHTADIAGGATGFDPSSAGWTDDGLHDYTIMPNIALNPLQPLVLGTPLTIPAGFSQMTILVPIWNDSATTDAPKETFSLILDQFDGAGPKSGASSITLVGTIVDDEPSVLV
jgi:hypothetical protein